MRRRTQATVINSKNSRDQVNAAFLLFYVAYLSTSQLQSRKNIYRSITKKTNSTRVETVYGSPFNFHDNPQFPRLMSDLKTRDTKGKMEQGRGKKKRLDNLF